MHDPTIYKAKFSGLICSAFNKEQVLKLRIELTMYQIRDCPTLWTHTPTLPTGRPHMEANSPAELARLIEGAFVERLTDWLIYPGRIPVASKGKPLNVVPIDKRRRA